MNVFNMTKEDFDTLPYCTDRKQLFDTIILIPTEKMHDSGYRCIKFVGTTREDVYVLGEGSDILHIDGIGGRGDWQESDQLPELVKPRWWRIDMLPCGYIRLFCGDKIKISDIALSDSEIWAKDNTRQKIEGTFYDE